jgi:hypothetical protein
MCTQIKVRAIDALLPPELIKYIEDDEKTMMAAATLVVNLMQETIQYVEKKIPKGLDAFPGDRLCQGRLIILPELFEKPEVCQEMKQLAEMIKAKLQILIERRKNQNCSCSSFFEKEIATLEISEDVRYLMDCRLLMITRATKLVEPSGVIHTMTDHGNLTKLSPKIQLIERKPSRFRELITLNACMRVSAESMVRLQDYSRGMNVPPLLQRMIGQVVVLKPDGYPPRTFGCQFFTVHLALCRLLEQKTPVAIRTIVPAGKLHSCIFFKPKENAFEFQSLDEARQLPKSSYVAIFHAVVPSEDNLIAKVHEIGFIELILRYAAQEVPFEHRSSHDDVKDAEARQLLEEYRDKAAKSGCNHELLRLHHLYSTTIQEEVK